jgi:cholest-4-en-3-one 26-monooxygenase
MINMDAPRHTKLRLIVNRGFTPRTVNQLGDYVTGLAARIVDDVESKGKIDFVEEIRSIAARHHLPDGRHSGVG